VDTVKNSSFGCVPEIDLGCGRTQVGRSAPRKKKERLTQVFIRDDKTFVVDPLANAWHERMNPEELAAYNERDRAGVAGYDAYIIVA
jgi:hypothetical protein